MGRLADFLIVGAAKSGTTSLHYYLGQHPYIEMSKPKEPKFLSWYAGIRGFNGPGDKKCTESRVVKSYDDYLNIFSAESKDVLCGESSTDNLYFHIEVIPLIKKIIGEPKIIIILRNPVDRAFSAYTHLVREGRENETFERALELEDERIKKGYSFIWHYKNVGFYYEQVKDYLENFSDVKVCLYDDLRKDPIKLVQDIFRFLGVDDNFVPANIGEKYNVSGVPKSKSLHRFLRTDNAVMAMFLPIIRTVFPKRTRDVIKNRIRQANLKRMEMKPETRMCLKEVYRDDILKLQNLIKRDLSHWLK